MRQSSSISNLIRVLLKPAMAARVEPWSFGWMHLSFWFVIEKDIDNWLALCIAQTDDVSLALWIYLSNLSWHTAEHLAGGRELYRVNKKSEGNFHVPQLPYKRFAVANVTKLGLCSLEVNCTYILKKIGVKGASLVVHWLKLHTPNAGGLGSIAGEETRSHIPHLKLSAAK